MDSEVRQLFPRKQQEVRAQLKLVGLTQASWTSNKYVLILYIHYLVLVFMTF